MTLTETIYYFRRITPLAIFSLIFIILFYWLIKLSWPLIFPPPPTKLEINPIFGSLPKIKFSQTLPYLENINFILDTVEGEPITATQTAKVFYLYPRSPRFGYLERIYLMAKIFGFDTEKIKHKTEDKTAIFTDENKKLTVDITNFNFYFERNYKEEPELFGSSSALPAKEIILEKTKEFLRNLNRYPEELAKGKENLIFLNYHPIVDNFKVVEENEANAFEVDFYRPDIEEFPIVTPKYYNSQNFVIGTFDPQENLKIIKAQIMFFEKEEEKVGIYPLKTGQEAWEELINKKATIVSLGEKTNEILIKKMFLGYYDPDVFQEYLQPVYVFVGKNGFVAYVPAIKEEYTQH